MIQNINYICHFGTKSFDAFSTPWFVTKVINKAQVLHICAPLEEHWLQKMRFVGSNASFSLMFLYT